MFTLSKQPALILSSHTLGWSVFHLDINHMQCSNEALHS